MSVSLDEIKIRQQLAALSPAKRTLLELRLMKKNGRPRARTIIPRRTGSGPAPLSHNQRGLWLLSELLPGSSLYQIPKAVRLTGQLDLAALKRTLEFILERHEALRTTFAKIDGTPVQVIHEPAAIDLPLIDLSEWPAAEREAMAQTVIDDEGRRPFDLEQGPLMRSILVRLNEDEHILLVTLHHIVTDGWSMGVFHREFTEVYEAFAAGRPAPLPELPIQYADYAVWQQEWFGGALYESQLAYWKNQFSTLPPVLEVPADHPRSATHGSRIYRGNQQTLTISKELTRQLNSLAQQEGVTPFMLLLAAFEVLLHRYTGEEDIAVGTPIAGRSVSEVEPLIGLFINVLALRVSVAGNPTFRELLGRVKQVALDAYANQDLPFETLVRELQPDRTALHNPIFQVMFVLQSETIPPLELSGLKVSHFQVNNVTTNFDLTLDIVERDGQYLVKFESNAELFEPDTIGRMMGHFETLLGAIVADPVRRVSDLPILTDRERRQLLVEWNNTATDYPAHKSIHELFEEQAAQSPEAVAVITDKETLSYSALNAEANRLANWLRARGVIADTRVGVCMHRSPEMIIAILAILKAGGAYVPLDPSYPQSRLQFMVEDSRSGLILTEQSLRESLITTAEVVCLDDIEGQLQSQSESDLTSASSSDNLAYVIYTSGSTGTPKGVAVTHRNVLRLVKNTNYASFSPDEVFLQSSTISFDASTFEIWGSLLNGAQLVLLPPGNPSLSELASAVKRHGVTTLWLTAGLFHLMVENHLDDLRGLRQLLAGGDVLSVPHVQTVVRELPNCRLINGYGPTENTTFTCCYPVQDLSRVNGSVPIGFPISNTTVYVLDRNMTPVPVGVPGELYIGGDGLARGYLDQPELTAERFVSNPFATSGDARLYRTGDIVRYRQTGEIEFIGRGDNQVKVRGFRIELGEIEAALVQHPDVREAAVVACKDAGDKHLAAYLVSRNGHLVTEEVRNFLQQRLPNYMVPSVFVRLPELPLSPTGKVDRRALASANASQREIEKPFVGATDELELKLTQIWERVLNVRPIGVTDNFFELGGHSLLAVRLFAEIEKTFDKNLPLATLFQAPTLRQLACALRDDGWQPAWSSLVTIQAGNTQRPPFFCIHASGGNVLEYHDLARTLGPQQPFYGMQAKGLDGQSSPHTTIEEMAAHYITEMRELQPHGPYFIGGRSSGGTIAFEMACQLEAAGEKVALLALLDTYPAGYFKLLRESATFRGRLARRARRWRSHLSNLRQRKGLEKVQYVLTKLSYVPAKARHKLYRRVYKIYRRVGRSLPPVLRNIEELNFAAVKDYVPRNYSGKATLFVADDLTSAYDVEDGWRQLVADLEVIQIPGNHLDIIKEPHVGVLGEKLAACIVENSER